MIDRTLRLALDEVFRDLVVFEERFGAWRGNVGIQKSIHDPIRYGYFRNHPKFDGGQNVLGRHLVSVTVNVPK